MSLSELEEQSEIILISALLSLLLARACSAVHVKENKVICGIDRLIDAVPSLPFYLL